MIEIDKVKNKLTKDDLLFGNSKKRHVNIADDDDFPDLDSDNDDFPSSV